MRVPDRGRLPERAGDAGVAGQAQDADDQVPEGGVLILLRAGSELHQIMTSPSYPEERNEPVVVPHIPCSLGPREVQV